jgi:probable rRNA maturation factor
MTANPEIPTDIEIDIVKRAGDWPPVDEIIALALQKAFEHLNFVEHSEVSVVLADDAFVRELNKNYRGKDKPTNVLSFPQIAAQDLASGLHGALGDIVLALETVRAEAARDGKSFEHHLSHLVVHGLLHLLGLDHENEEEAEEMEALEASILESLGIKNPY